MRIEGWRTNLCAPRPNARRIVSIAPSTTEILHALGLGRRIVGVDRWSDYPPRVLRLPQVGSDLHVDVERVAELNPDLVVASLHVPGMEDNLPAFERAGFSYLALGGLGLAGIWDDMRVIGRYLGREQRAQALVDDTRARMARVAARSATSHARPRVHWEWSAHPYVAARRSWITELLEMAGGQNIYSDLDVESVRVSPEDAIARQPDVVVACWCGARKLPSLERILARPGWQDTPAIRQRRVAVFKEDLFGRPGPRLAQGLEQLAALLNPA
ncbi:MAG: cobalamin-binding protein [Chloroflexota bacterium]|nr:cobalamin-binding protein [Chloroflexota bacterium]